jgi:predicted transposase/invertase (TIGR01784 family)
MEYRDLPRTFVISIINFKQYKCEEFHSEFWPLEIRRHEPLTDKCVIRIYELPKLPKVDDGSDELKLWLTLFKAETEEDLAKIEAMGVSVMQEAIAAYRQVSASDEFKEIERLRSRARHNEASALGNARREGQREGIAIGAETEREKWQGVVADKDAILADKDAALAKQAAQIEELMAQLGKKK